MHASLAEAVDGDGALYERLRRETVHRVREGDHVTAVGRRVQHADSHCG
jgi:hypothetical protein